MMYNATSFPRRIGTLAVALLAISTFALGGIIEDQLKVVLMETPTGGYVKVMALMKERVDVDMLTRILDEQKATRADRYTVVLNALQEKAASTQTGLLEFLAVRQRSLEVQDYESFWIQNMISFTAQREVIEAVAARADVDEVFIQPEMKFDLPEDQMESTERVASVENGVRAVNAPALWRLGITGQGRLLMNIDTGVLGTHPALSARWRGNQPGVQPTHAFYPTGNPTDSDGHGTHVMGIMTGMDPVNQDTVGVAPGALWIAGSSSYTGAFQWAVNPDGNPVTMNDVPDVINCSWYSNGDPCTGGSQYWSLMDNVEAVGIAVIWSAGNCGPGGSAGNCVTGVLPGAYMTITPPKNRATTDINAFSVGNLDGNNPAFPISSSSSRGPSACDSTVMRPNVSAPGSSVRSAIQTGGYGLKSGTSMAAPHVAGAVGLLRQVNPNATVAEIKYALMESARDLGTPGRDNTYGTGLINVLAAAGKVSPYQLNGTVRNGSNQQPVANATIEVISTSQEVTSASNGSYNIGPLQSNVQVRYSAYAFYDTTISVLLAAGVPQTLNVAITPLPSASISGTVADSLTAQGIRSKLSFYREGDPTGGPTMTTTSTTNGSFNINGTIGNYMVSLVPAAPYADSVVLGALNLPLAGTTLNPRLLPAEMLFVDDDGGALVNASYAASLKRLAYRYRTFSVADSGATPSNVLNTFAQPPVLLWITGDDTATALTTAERRTIMNHFARGGRAILVGNNIAQSSALDDSLVEQHLGVRFNGNSTQVFMRGFTGDVIGDGVVSWLVSGASKDMLSIIPGSSGTPTKSLYYGTTANDTANIAAVRVLGPVSSWAATFFGFGLEGLAVARQDSLILRSMRYFGSIVTSVTPRGDGIPAEYALEQNYPNPFNPVTSFQFAIPGGTQHAASLRVFDLLGREVATLFNEVKQPGIHTVQWDASGMASGVYLYRLEAGDFRETKKLLLLK